MQLFRGIKVLYVSKVILISFLFLLSNNALAFLASYYYPAVTSSVDPNIASREAFLQKRDNNFYASLAGKTSAQVMTMLAPGGDGGNGPNGLNDNMLGGVDPKSADSIQRQGAAQLLELALYHGFSNYLADAVAKVQEDIGIRIMQFRLWVAEDPTTNAPNGDVKQRQERGDIAWEAWLLNQAGKYFTSPPGKAVPVRPTSLADLTGATTQGLMEAFTSDYVEALSPTMTWPTTGYNKEVAQGLHPAFMIGLYGNTNYQTLYPSSFKGFFVFWNGMLAGANGSYEPENTPSYGNFNVSMVMDMGLTMNRLVRPTGSTDPYAYISDSVDMPRILNRFVTETMSNGNAVNYNKAISSWVSNYAFNSPENTGPFNLKIGYSIFQNPAYLYMARKLEMNMLTNGILSNTRLDATELYPVNIQHYAVLNVPAPTAQSILTEMRISPSCYNGLLLCRAAPQSETKLIPSKIMLQTGQTDFAPYVLMSIAGAGQHANLDQRMTLENTLFNGAYITARPFRPCQVNQSNSALVAPTSLAFPVFSRIVGDCESAPVPTNFYTDMGLNPALNNYILADATARQLATGEGIGTINYSQYEYPGIHAIRQVILRPNGIILVKDSMWNDGTAKVTVNGGLTYRLWPSVAASGTNWALQAPLQAITSSLRLSSASNVSTLYYIANATGRNFGMDVEPLSDVYSSPGSQTLTTFYSYESLADNQVHSFVSILLPLKDTTAVSTIVNNITVTTNSAGATTVTIPDMNGNIVETFSPISTTS
jgi:hypothetical protein